MPRKSAGRRRGARASQKAVAAGNGVVARALDRAFENPAMSGGLLVMALTATAIVSNAMFLQTGHHPEPLFAARPSAPLPKLAPGDARVTKRSGGAAIAPPAPSLAPSTAASAEESETVLVTSIQRELARLGLYIGSIDGIAGSRTTTAIAAYETAAGRPVTGTPTPELLDFIRSAPPPAPAGVSRAATRAPATSTRVASAPPVDTYRRVQTALNRAGYGPIAVDGQPGSETADAIRRFELDNGLPITGEIGDRVLARLVAVGAMNPL